MVEQITCRLPVGKILVGWCVCETSGAYSLMMSGARLKDTEIFLPSQKILGVRSWGRVADSKMPGQLSPSRKVLGGKGLNWEKY